MGPIPLYVGLRPVFVKHGKMELDGRVLDPVEDDIDPACRLSPKQIAHLRAGLPHASGFRVHMWGFVDVLFDTQQAFDLQNKLPKPVRLGLLFYTFVLTYPSRSPSSSGERCSWKSGEVKEALLSAVDYRFQGADTQEYLLWRTGANDYSVPFVEVDAVVLQTYKSKLFDEQFFRADKMCRRAVTFKAGVFLPGEMLDGATITVHGCKVSPNLVVRSSEVDRVINTNHIRPDKLTSGILFVSS
ncbi:hypothetical protein B0H16DRAFT_1851422 [Mycena metata]|uniref:Uncharacterized protein n=1 Tax=Mycena metata TaxID=1033252 RepID=A0AAD7INT2_9AGAR|nr:hypothetical protein B0H16DRAFT_1851422 [Mycena metata]